LLYSHCYFCHCVEIYFPFPFVTHFVLFIDLLLHFSLF
jgi:hypothetical protein